MVFLAARFILGKAVQEKYSGSLEKFNREIEENGRSYLLTLRFIPIFPFWLINLMAGFTTVRAGTFIWTTAVGIIPGSFVYAYIGHAGQAVFKKGIFTPEILIALALLAACQPASGTHQEVETTRLYVSPEFHLRRDEGFMYQLLCQILVSVLADEVVQQGDRNDKGQVFLAVA